jgi:hypothetical protein
MQIIDHELEDRLDLLLAVPGVMCERGPLAKSDRSLSKVESIINVPTHLGPR